MASLGKSLGDMVVRIIGDSTSLDKTINKSEKSVKGLGTTATKTSKIMETAGKLIKTAFVSAIVAGVVKIGKELISVASDAEEIRNKFDVTFSSISDAANTAATDLADGFGLSQVAAEDLLSTTGDLLSGFGFTQTAALDLATQTNELAADLASFANVPVKQASDAITKGLLGERESMKLLGIAILEADINQLAEDKGIVGELTRQQKALLTLELATKQSKNAIGDFARSQDSFANQSKIAQANVDDLKVAMGKGLLPIATASISAFGDLTEKLTEFINERQRLKEERESEDPLFVLRRRLGEIRESLPIVTGEYERLNDGVQQQIELGYKVTDNDKNRLEDLKALKIAQEAEQAAIIAKLKSTNDQALGLDLVLSKEQELANLRALADEKFAKEVDFRDAIWSKTEEARRQAIEAEIAELETYSELDIKAQQALAYLREELAGFTEDVEEATQTQGYLIADYTLDAIEWADKLAIKKAEDAQKELDEIERVEQARKDAAAATYSALKGFADVYFASQLSQEEQGSEAYKKLKTDQFNFNKATSAIDTGIAGALAAIRAFAELGPIGGSIAAGIIAGLTTAQVGFILAQQPPAFADGGIVMPTPGGTIAQVAEAGQPEVIFPLDKLQSMMGGKMGGQTVVFNNLISTGSESEMRLAARKFYSYLDDEGQRRGGI